MSNLKKTTLIFCLFLFVFACSCRGSNRLSTDNWGSFTNKSKLYSYDNFYYSIQSLQDDMVTIQLYTSANDELMYEFEPCRSWDYWGMVWENDRYAFWIQSGDIGVFCVKLDEGEWIVDYSCERPDYIESRYDSLLSEE